MPPEPFVVPRFAAEPTQEHLPSGRWADTLRAELLKAALDLGDIGEPGDIVWFPDRTYAGRTFVPATARTSSNLELFGYVSYVVSDEPGNFHTVADVTEEIAEEHPEWKVDLCDEVIGSWRGPGGKTAQMTLVWGVPQVAGGAVATAELGGRVRVTVDQCALVENRLTLIAPDDFGGDTLEVRVYDAGGKELAVESLYEEDDEEDADAS
ncbi:MAG: hypothetical protein JWM73_2356 [Solirubrobacterales bacterium]|jgi:hypothetical protein|nr:hypothetical protein [Solirubrobacterales bacterium]